MTPNQAATVIGCSGSQVRYLIRTQKLNATTWESPGGFYYDVSQKEAERYRDTEQSHGWPRGQSKGAK